VDGEALTSASVTVGNSAPVMTLMGPEASDEGQTKSYSFTVNDPDADAFTLLSATCDGGTKSDQVFNSATGAGSFKCLFPNGPATHTVSVRVKDSDDAADSDSVTVSVVNVVPLVQKPTVLFDPVTSVATLSAAFTDAGKPENFSGSFTLNVNGETVPVTGDPVTQTSPPNGSAGTLHGTANLPRGCNEIVVTATVDDGDSGVTTSDALTVSSQDVYRIAFKDPIRDNERNIAKYGNVVPIKAALTRSCGSGGAITSAQLHVTFAKGMLDDAAPDDNNPMGESVSTPDSGTQMRLAGDMYVYNLSTRSMLGANQDYTIRVRNGSATGPIIARAVIHAKR
jgi:hypothetical protein